jgi:hypothetical protein
MWLHQDFFLMPAHHWQKCRQELASKSNTLGDLTKRQHMNHWLQIMKEELGVDSLLKK